MPSAKRMSTLPGIAHATAAENVAYVGGGSLPDQAHKTWVVEIEAKSRSDADVAQRLRTGTPAVMSRLRGGKVVLDVRTIFPSQEADLVQAVSQACAS